MTGPERFAQLTHTSFDRRDGRAGGAQVKEVRGELSDAERASLEAGVATRFEWPVEVPRFVGAQARRALPSRVVHAPLPGGAQAYWHTVPAGTDGTGRPGNVFAHVLLDRRPTEPRPPLRPTDLARSPHWLRPFGQQEVVDATLDAVPDPTAWIRPHLDEDLQILLDPDRAALLAVLLDAVRAAMAGDRPVVLALRDPAAGLPWIAAVSRLMSPGASRRFHWSSSERRSGLPAAWQRGLHLAVVPVADIVQDADPGPALVLREDAPPQLGSLDGVPHGGGAGPSVAVTEWSVLAGVVLQDRDTAARALRELDEVAAESGDAGLDPAWPMAVAAQLLRIPETGAEADAVIRAASPPAGALPPALREQVYSPVLRAIDGDGPADAYIYACRPGAPPAAAEVYLERAVADTAWLRQRGGAPVPPTAARRASGLRTIAEHAVTVAEDRARRRRTPTLDEGAHVLLMLDLLVRAGLFDGAGPDDPTVEAALRLVERVVAPSLEPDGGRAIAAATGPLPEATQALFVRPAVGHAVAGIDAPPGDRLAPSVLRWLHPVPPRPPRPDGRYAAQEPDALLVEVAAQATAVATDPSEWRALALWAAPTTREGAATADRLLVPGAWRPDELVAAAPVVGVEALFPVLADVLLRRPGGPSTPALLALVPDDEPPPGATASARRGLLAVRLRRMLARPWWHVRSGAEAHRAADRLLSTVEQLDGTVDAVAPDILTQVAAACAVSAIWNPLEPVSPALSRLLAQVGVAGGGDEAAAVLVDCVHRGLVDDVAVAIAAVVGAAHSPWRRRSPEAYPRFMALAGVPVVSEGRPFPLLEQVLRLRARAGAAEPRTGLSQEITDLLVRSTRNWALTAGARRAWVADIEEFVPRWWTALGATDETGGRRPGLRRMFGGGPDSGVERREGGGDRTVPPAASAPALSASDERER